MKDIIGNRKRISLAQKWQILGLTLRENGVLYTLLLGFYYAGSGLSNRAFEQMQKLRKQRGLPGLNSRSLNAKIWDDWDWEAAGDEWTPSPEWKSSLVKSILRPRVVAGSRVVEIGPGAGRWTEHLIPLAVEYQGIDISSTCVEICSAKFAQHGHAKFRVNDGNDLPGVADGSVDVIWSFDVFVHINLADIARYLEEFKRVLKPGGVAIIHHGTTAGHSGGWRSDVTTAELNALIGEKGLLVKEQFGDWHDEGDRFEVGLYEDQVTVMGKPV